MQRDHREQEEHRDRRDRGAMQPLAWHGGESEGFPGDREQAQDGRRDREKLRQGHESPHVQKKQCEPKREEGRRGPDRHVSANRRAGQIFEQDQKRLIEIESRFQHDFNNGDAGQEAEEDGKRSADDPGAVRRVRWEQQQKCRGGEYEADRRVHLNWGEPRHDATEVFRLEKPSENGNAGREDDCNRLRAVAAQHRNERG
jgi:hypothetical protein